MHDCWLPAVPVFVQLSTNATGERAGDGPNSRRPDSRMEFPVEVLGSGLCLVQLQLCSHLGTEPKDGKFTLFSLFPPLFSQINTSAKKKKKPWITIPFGYFFQKWKK